MIKKFTKAINNVFLLKISIRISVALFIVQAIHAQENYLDTANLIPNPSFEQFTTFPLGWFYKGEHFTELVRFWSSPTMASPDVYGPDIMVPSNWRKHGFGGLTPVDGQSMVGITLFGCQNGKPHCREYIQVPLMQPLVIGQQYYISFNFAHLRRSIQIDNLGFIFETEPMDNDNEEPIASDQAIVTPGIKYSPSGSWRKMEHSFTATEPSSYLIIGNFLSDQLTNYKKIEPDGLNYAYYYIDAVTLKKIPPIVNRPITDSSILKKHIHVGHTILLNNIYFDTDKTDFHPISFVELNELHQLLIDYPTMIIEVQGHTDDQGTEMYNEILSLNRAEAVAQYLLDHGIKMDRVKYRGFGSKQPIARNTTDDGRQENRRVEFKILAL